MAAMTIVFCVAWDCVKTKNIHQVFPSPKAEEIKTKSKKFPTNSLYKHFSLLEMFYGYEIVTVCI